MPTSQGKEYLMSVFGCASDEKLKDELEEMYSPCENCELNYIYQCASCPFASPSINDSLNYNDDEEW